MTLDWVMTKKELEKKGFFRVEDIVEGTEVMKGELGGRTYEFERERADSFRLLRHYTTGHEDKAIYVKRRNKIEESERENQSHKSYE